ncbi:hypothetical protein [Anaerotardibacter muris]|uniref:hypothetical protein n=1 Tax=Anaerotardibacter muris TaxID=2941505 RepID=UPI00204121E7|nr:hypothetical protein [Anaerotardibacter muris]
MTKSQLRTVPHLPVPIDTKQRNPLPTYHTSTSLKRERVPLRTQSVALHPTGVSPVPLKTIPTRPIEVQPISKVPLPGGTTRLPYFAPPKKRVSDYGRWGRIKIATQEPQATLTGPEDLEIIEESQVVFAVGETHAHPEQTPDQLNDTSVDQPDAGSVIDQPDAEAAIDQPAAEAAIDQPSAETLDICSDQGVEDRTTGQPGTFISDRVPIRENVALPMQHVPLARMPRMKVGLTPIRTHTAAIRRRKNAPRPKKSASARIW